MPDLFSPFALKDVVLRNRMCVSPMCQYSAQEGVANAWHAQNYGSRAAGGAGLVIVEATAVSPEGRITPGDLGLWNDAQAQALAPILAFAKAQGAVPGLQIAHAGRKASARRPWEGDAHIPRGDPDGWEIIAPSPEAFGAKLPRVPRVMDLEDIARVQDAFVAAAKRALDIGVEWLELHFAHGYLGQSFFSPLANRRTDAYGGDFEGRSRFLREVLDKVRAVWPERLPLTARLGVMDFVPGEQPLEESIALVRRFREAGLDLIDVSIGSNTPDVSRVPWREPAFMTPIAARIGREVAIPVATSWNVGEPRRADALIREGALDLVMLAKSVLADPFWPYHAALALGREAPFELLPPPYAAWLGRSR